MGRSNDGPSLRRSAGARLTVMRRDGNSKAELTIAARTRSRLSWTAASGSPTMLNAGAAATTSASTSTGWPSEAAQSLAGDAREHAASLVCRRLAAGTPVASSVERERAGQMPHRRRDALEASTATMSKRTSLDAAQRPGARRQPQLGETGDLAPLARADGVFRRAARRPSGAP